MHRVDVITDGNDFRPRRTITNAQMIENASQIQISRRFAILLSMTTKCVSLEKTSRGEATQVSLSSSTFWKKRFGYSNRAKIMGSTVAPAQILAVRHRPKPWQLSGSSKCKYYPRFLPGLNDERIYVSPDRPKAKKSERLVLPDW